MSIIYIGHFIKHLRLSTLLSILIFFLTISSLLFPRFSIVKASENKFPYDAPFHVKDSVILDRNGRKVKLWGVNYLAPFNHNFINIAQSGIDHQDCIDKDFEHFRLMKVDFIRVHLYDREITDAQGNLIENDHLKYFDYLVEKSFQEGIFLMLTPTVWWNTSENEMRMRQGYAYWDLSQFPNFGFSNYFAKDAILWHPQALECQKNYLRGLFSHKNRFSGKRLCEYSNIIALELTNEPSYINMNRLENEPAMGSDLWIKGEKPKYLKPLFEEFVKQNTSEQNISENTNSNTQILSDAPTRKELFKKFRGEILRRYFKELWPVVDEYFDGRILKTHICYSMEEEPVRSALQTGGVQVINVCAYPQATGKFDGGNTDWANYLIHLSNWLTDQKQKNFSGFAKCVYEYGAPGSLDGYVVGAFAAAFRRADIQMAAFFTYTPSAVAAYNPGWLIHYLNLEHTPNKAAGFAAAGEIYRQDISIDQLKRGNDQWTGNNFAISRNNKNVEFYNGKILRYAATSSLPLTDPSLLREISGRGNSSAVAYSGNGSYYLSKRSDEVIKNEKYSVWKLSLFPNEKIVNDPAGVQTFRHMANRYMNIDDMPVVSRLLSRPEKFRLKIGQTVRIETLKGNRSPKQLKDGSWELWPGEYLLFLRKSIKEHQ